MGGTIGSEATCNNRLVRAIGLGARACSTANAWVVDWNHIAELLSVTSDLPWWSATLLVESCNLSCQLHDLFTELNKLTTVILMVDCWGLRTNEVTLGSKTKWVAAMETGGANAHVALCEDLTTLTGLCFLGGTTLVAREEGRWTFIRSRQRQILDPKGGHQQDEPKEWGQQLLMVSQDKPNNLHGSITDLESNAVPIHGLKENKGGGGNSSRSFDNRTNNLHEVQEVWGTDTSQNPKKQPRDREQGINRNANAEADIGH